MTALRLEKISDYRGFGLAAYLRTTVYILEQDCPPCEEFDSTDNTAQHYLGWAGDVPVTTCRVYEPEKGSAGIGRIVTASDHRGKGYASAMLRMVMDDIRKKPDVAFVKMSAQDHAIGLYEKLGFKQYGDGYMEAGIPHHMMKLDLREAA